MTYFLRNKALENFSQMFTLTGESFEYAGTLWGKSALARSQRKIAVFSRVNQTRQV
ncbi:hypothetical protein Sbal223_4346 (plasmid) [Shewanella baltica OS223]|nr:hypothetical protein Sbal223_4346 [Shewanella baltica OS223]